MFSAAVYLHNLDPVIFDLFGGWSVRWYGMSYLLGFVVGYALIRRVASHGISSVRSHEVDSLVFALAMGVLIGGRLGYCLFYDRTLWGFSGQFPFWKVLAIHRGGMASHGGIVGAIVAAAYFAWRHKHRPSHVIDLLAFAAPMGLFFGRVANFINGELYGRPCDPSLPWAVKFPQEMVHWPADRLDPVFDRLASEIPQNHGWSLDAIISAIRHGQRNVVRIVEPALTPRHPSQLYEGLLEGLALAVILAALWARPKKPMVIGATFLLVYGVFRIIVEQFREPDAGIGFQWLGLTRGQWLSVPLPVAGLVLLVIFSRRKVEPMGGWRGRATVKREPANRV